MPDSDDHLPLARRLADLEERVSELEASRYAAPRVEADPDLEFWALEELKVRAAERSAVLFTGSVTLPTGARHEWQQGFDVDALLASDWTLDADALGALGNPTRLRLLHQILSGVESASELGALDGLGTTGQLYHHLRRLVAAGWLHSGGRGRYTVPSVRVVPLLIVIAASQR